MSQERRKTTRARGLLTFTLTATLAMLVAASSAQASSLISFNPGNGTISGISSFNYAPGDVVAAGLPTSGTVGVPYTVYYQSNLTSVTGPGGLDIGNFGPAGLNGSGTFFNVVAAFGETISAATVLPGAGSNRQQGSPAGGSDDALSITLAFNPAGATNFFRIYASPAKGDPITGTGFATGPVILSGHIVADGFSGGFLEDGDIVGGVFVPHTELLNQSGGASGQPAGTRTVTGSGSTNLRVVVDFQNFTYFPNALGILALDFTTTNSLPFQGVPPSTNYYNGTTTTPATPGATNGNSGPDFMFQSVAQNSFTLSIVPEPSSVALAASSIVLSAGFFFRKRQKKA